MFTTGQKVICIDDANQFPTGNPTPNVKKGKTYTIRGFRPGTGGLYLVGLYLEIIAPGIERGFLRSRFRPLDDSFAKSVLEKTSVEIALEEMVLELEFDLAEQHN